LPSRKCIAESLVSLLVSLLATPRFPVSDALPSCLATTTAAALQQRTTRLAMGMPPPPLQIVNNLEVTEPEAPPKTAPGAVQ
jgi:hypothetical protein